MRSDIEAIREVDVAVVGSGSAGIAAARHLQTVRPDLSLVVLEAGSRIGGRAWSVKPPLLDGQPIDLGCGWLHGARTNAWTAIAGKVGLTVDRTPAPWSEGGRRLGGDTPEAQEAAAAIDAFFERAHARGIDLPDGSLAEVLEPGSRWNNRIEAIGTFLNGVELDQASIIDYNRYSPGEGPDWRVREGYGTLISRYGENLPVRLQTPVTLIDHSGADHVVLETSAGALRAKAVIVTVSTNMLANETLRFTPALPGKVEAAAKLPLGLDNKLFLRLPDGIDLPKDVHAYGSNARLAGSYQIRPFGTLAIEGYFGGQLARDLEKAGLEAALSFAREELTATFGSDLARQLRAVTISAWAQEAFIGGSYSYARPGAAFQREALASPVDDRLFFAGEACHTTRFSTAHGAYETGITAAEALAASATFAL